MTKKVRRASDSRGLDVRAWIEAGLRVIATNGIDGVRIESLAATLGVTKGSFYWHFADRESFLQQMLQEWRRKATIAVVERLEAKGGTPAERLMNLLMLTFRYPRAVEGENIELAIRIWGRRDETVLAVLAEIDQLRMRYISMLFAEMGLDGDACETRAGLVYSFMRVGTALPFQQDYPALLAKVVELLGLQECPAGEESAPARAL